MKKSDIYYLWIVRHLPDELFVRLHYLISCRKILHLKNPKLFNEKIQWMKLYDRNPEYTHLVDKVGVKEYVDDFIGPGYTFPTLGVWDSADQIDFSLLPDSFVLKPTHDSGSIVIVRDKKTADLPAICDRLNRSLARNYFYMGREWPYKNVKPRIIAEPYMVDESGTELKDYKILCFSGEPRLVQIDAGRFGDNHIKNTYTIDWQWLPLAMHYETDEALEVKKPAKFDEMLEICRRIAKGRPFIRVDFYVIDEKLYIGELTFMHDSDFAKIVPEEWNRTMGDWIDLNG